MAVCAADDAIASMGFYYSVAKVQAAQKTVIVATDREISFNMGDLLVFYAKDGENLGIAKISNMFSVDQPSETEGKPFNRWTDKDMKYDDASFMEVRRISTAENLAASLPLVPFKRVQRKPDVSP